MHSRLRYELRRTWDIARTSDVEPGCFGGQGYRHLERRAGRRYTELLLHQRAEPLPGEWPDAFAEQPYDVRPHHRPVEHPSPAGVRFPHSLLKPLSCISFRAGDLASPAFFCPGPIDSLASIPYNQSNLN